MEKSKSKKGPSVSEEFAQITIFFSLSNLNTEANKLYDRAHRLYDAALLTRYYTHHAYKTSRYTNTSTTFQDNHQTQKNSK